jgi:O-antigen/teichoic acid export membrane protein
MAFVLIFSFLADFGMVSLLIREVAARPVDTTQLLSDGMAAQMAVSAVATLALMIIGFSIEGNAIIRAGLALGAIALAIESLGRPFTAVIIGRGHVAVAAVVLAIASITNTVLILAVLTIFHTVLAVIAIGIPVAAVSALLPSLMVSRSGVRVRWTTSSQRVCRLFMAAAPFALLAGSTVLYDRVDVLMLSWLDSSRAVGVFSAADRVIEGLLVIPGAIGAALYPVMSADISAAAGPLRSTLRWSIPLCASVTMLCLFPGAIMVAQLYGSHFAGSPDAFRILAPTILLASLTIPLAYLLQAQRRTALAVLATSVGFITDLVFDLLLIPRYSVSGAATSATLAELTVLVALVLTTVLRGRSGRRSHERHITAKPTVSTTAKA